MTIFLSQKKCVACEGGVPPLTESEIADYQKRVRGWVVSADSKSISKELVFEDFNEALAFIDVVGAIAEEEGHHPDLNLHAYKKVIVTLSTHAIAGLSENDYIIAAKIDALPESDGK